MNSTIVNEVQVEPRVGPREGTAVSFSEPYERDGVTVISASAQRRRTFHGGPQDAEAGARLSSSHPLGAFVVRDGEVRWHPAVDMTRLLTTAEIVVGAVLVANRLARRPSAAKAQVTMGARRVGQPQGRCPGRAPGQPAVGAAPAAGHPERGHTAAAGVGAAHLRRSPAGAHPLRLLVRRVGRAISGRR